MTRQTIQDKLFALYRVSSEQLTDFLQGGNFDRYGIKANEFDVFCAFWTTACYLRSTATPAAREVENFNKSIVVTIVDRIIAASPEELSAEQLEALSQTVTDVFVERFSGYRDFFQADLQQRENESIRLFPRLVEGFLGSVLDAPVAEHSPVRQLFDGILADMLNKAVIFFAGATGDDGHGGQDEGREDKGKKA